LVTLAEWFRCPSVIAGNSASHNCPEGLNQIVTQHDPPPSKN
jgi:hypothetical protein